MGIQALPQTTIRTLGASQVLTDPVAVVKELVDNGLDAHATSVVIEISNNTLDCTQVRDNGHGIPPDDRPLVARPHCTSKIGSEEDLKDIGGTSLGFRGEALASVAEMSGSLHISTRVEGEQTATMLEINQAGEVVDQQRASSPVGTTVKITDFIKSNPVRKQVALKAADKTLKKIKQLLQSYAFARPHVRLQLRVLKAKNDKRNWMYAPKPGGNAEDAAFKIVGAACAAQCKWSVVEDRGYTVQAFLPRVDAEPSKVSNIGAFVSVDGRPVTTSRGTPKQAMKIFKEALKAAGSSLQGAKELFLYMDIACPVGSYDANVEPAKDDVLFEDPEIVLEALRKLFDAVYPVQQQESSSSTECEFLETEICHPANPLVGSLSPANLTAIDRRDDLQETGSLFASLEPPTERRSTRSNVYGSDEEDTELTDTRPLNGRTETDFNEIRQARKDVTLSNPWVMAKMNSSIKPIPLTSNDSAMARDPLSPPFTQSHSIDLKANNMATPRPSSPSSSFVRSFNVPDRITNERSWKDVPVNAYATLPPPQAYVSPISRMHSEADVRFSSSPRTQAPMYDNNHWNQTDLPTETPMPAARRTQAQQAKVNKPYVSPFGTQPRPEKVWFDHLENVENKRSSQTKRRGRAANNSGLVTQGETGEFVRGPRSLTPPSRNRDMREFLTSGNIYDSVSSLIGSRNYPTHRPSQLPDGIRVSSKPDDDDENGILRIRSRSSGFIPASELEQINMTDDADDSQADRPLKRRRTGETRVLGEVSHNAGSIDNDYRPGTERRPSSRRQRTADGSKPTRTKSSKLPLERVPAGQGTHSISIRVSTTHAAIAKWTGNIDQDLSLPKWNERATSGTYDALLAWTDPQTVAKLTERLRGLLIHRVSDCDMVQDLGELVSNALAGQGNLTGDVHVA